jgi:hypothetical protein
MGIYDDEALIKLIIFHGNPENAEEHKADKPYNKEYFFHLLSGFGFSRY